jgi:hypothetical protein
MTAIIHPDGLQSPVHTCSRLFFTRKFFEARDIGCYDGKMWTLYWPPTKKSGRFGIGPAPFGSPVRFGVHLCGCLLRYDCAACDDHAIWRLGPFYFDPEYILGEWPD